MGYPPISTPEDIAKLHAESNQLRQQQFTLATMGIGAVALSSWLIPMLPADSGEGAPQAAVAVFLLVLLTVLFMWSMSLRRLIAAISHYLDLRDASEWEPQFREFSNKPGTVYKSQTVAVCALYLVLGLVPVGEYVSLVVLTQKTALSSTQSMVVLIGGIAYAAALLVLTGRRKRYDRSVRTNWKTVLDEALADSERA